MSPRRLYRGGADLESSGDLSDKRTGVVADDLTGAMDTAGAFASAGLRTRVLIRPGLLTASAPSVDVLCINTQTRNVAPALARAPVSESAKALRAQGFGRIYKKVDSTLRGNVAAECASVVQAVDAKVAIVCPAFPRMGRTLVQGRLTVHGSPLSSTREGNDPLSAPDSDSLVELLRVEGEVETGLVAISTVRQGPGAIEAEIRKLMDRGSNAIVVDAETDDHLESIATAWASASMDSVMVGSAGLAYALAYDADAPERAPVVHGSGQGPVLIVAGSAHHGTRAQLSSLESDGLATLVPMSPERTLDSRESRAGHAKELVGAVGEQLEAGRHVALFWSDSGYAVGCASPSAADAATLASFAGLVVYGVLRAVPVKGLIVAGGDTAFDVLRTLGASSVDVLGEVEAGVPYGFLSVGIARGVTLVTKAGGFGDSRTLARALDFVTNLSRPER
jgi:uncharacterized protein YgbK (DUF1537 family)